MNRAFSTTEEEVAIPAEGVRLGGILRLPPGPRGVVLFAHGSGSGRYSPRNTAIARLLEAGGFATLLMDLLTEHEAEDRRNVFDIGLLARRLLECTDYLGQRHDTADLPAAYFGASTGAGAALMAAAESRREIAAVVSRGGRPDLAGGYLARVRAPTLMIVGGNDVPVIPLNEQALSHLQTTKQFMIVPGATHLFEEPGALEEVARLARQWFERFVPTTADESSSDG